MEKFAITSLLLLTILAVSMSGYNTADFISEDGLHSNSEVILAESSFGGEELQDTDAKEVPPVIDLLKVTSTVTLDTLPKGKNRLIVEREDQKMEVEIEDGEIKAMKIDGKEVPKEEFEQHVTEVEKLWETDEGHEESNVWVFPSDDDNIFKFHSKKDGNVEFLFDSEEGDVIDLKMDGLFFDSDGESIFVFPDSEGLNFDFEFSEDAMDEYKDQLIELKLHLKENSDLNELKIKELKEHQLQLAKKYKIKAKEKADRHRAERIIIREKEHLDRLKWVEEKEKHKHSLFELKEGQHKLKLQNELLHNNSDFFVFDSHSGNKSDRLIKHLHEDGLVNMKSGYKVELSDKHLKVNGKKQSKSMHQKYRKLYEKLSGFEMAKKTKIVIENK